MYVYVSVCAEQLILAWFRVVTTMKHHKVFYLLSHSVEIARANSNFSRCDEYHHKNPSNTPAAAVAAQQRRRRLKCRFIFVLFISFVARVQLSNLFLPPIHSHGHAPILRQSHRQPPHSHTHTHTGTHSHTRQMTTVRVRFTLPFAIFERNSLCALSGSPIA